jgi:hypothetical protein
MLILRGGDAGGWRSKATALRSSEVIPLERARFNWRVFGLVSFVAIFFVRCASFRIFASSSKEWTSPQIQLLDLASSTIELFTRAGFFK